LSVKRNRDAVAFSTAKLSVIECDIFQFVSHPFMFGTGNAVDADAFFFIQFGLLDDWIDGAYFGPNPKLLSSKL
jgi:hypothetical protein